MTHTPGPWKFAHDNPTTDADYEVFRAFADLVNRVGPVAAKSLLNAAPDLLEALEAVYRTSSRIPSISPDWHMSEHTMRIVRAAIAKARGQS